jgi:hypothetical protein
MLRPVWRRETIFRRSNFYLVRFCRTQDDSRIKILVSPQQSRRLRSSRSIFNSGIAAVLRLMGYPVSLSTKKRDCLVAYSHSAPEHFKNAFNARRNVNE